MNELERIIPDYSGIPSVRKVFALESLLLSMESAMDLLPVRHWILDGIFCREMFIPKGCALTGHVHRYQHLAMCTQGHIAVYDESGHHEIKAGDIFVSAPGIKRAGYAFEDTRFINVFKIHPDDSEITDPEELLEKMIYHEVKSYADFLRIVKNESQLIEAES